MNIKLDADKDAEFLEKHPELLQNNEDSDDGIPHSRSRKLTFSYMSEEEKERLLEMYGKAIVQDFEDGYHMSREEREKQREQFAKFFKLRKFPKKIRRLDTYVEAMRLVVSIIEEMAEDNKIYSPDRFKKMVYKGDIIINGLTIPKFLGKKKKSINWDYVAEFVEDLNRDPEILQNPLKDQDQHEIDSDCLFLDSEYERFNDLYNKSETENIVAFDPASAIDYAGIADKKTRKTLIKTVPSLLKIVKNLTDPKTQRNGAMIWELNSDDYDEIEEYDRKFNRNRTSAPEFHGSLMKQSDVDAYLYQMEQYEAETELIEYNGKLITIEEAEDIEYSRMLEENGFNIRALYGNKDRKKLDKQRKKEDDRKSKELKKRLAEIEQRRTTKYDIYGNIVEDKETGKKDKKKKDKKKKKAEKKTRKHFDQILLDAVEESKDEDFEMYEKKMKEMRWGE